MTDTPKRAMSAYLFFSHDWRERMRAEHPNAPLSQIAVLLGRKWKELSDSEKEPYNEMARKDRMRVDMERAAYGAKTY